ncbi:hypothetical protein ALC57_05756 [Trachymyrmex cornetzi]|uniref:Uncharacterized protein n=1 Tax=Trachymyrmex cornetzi TaxID=471704 RepID=A0A151JA67_9HYME|nr:hypothetical protein ALC57_05756 [Trachymyrmex cornetzi]
MDSKEVILPASPLVKSGTILNPPAVTASNDENADGLTRQLFGSDFINVEVQPWNDHVTAKWHSTQLSLNPEARAAVSKINDAQRNRPLCDGAMILANLFYRLSLSRRAQIDKRDRLLQKTLTMLRTWVCKIRLFPSYIGSLISICPAVQYGILHIKILEREAFILSIIESQFGRFDIDLFASAINAELDILDVCSPRFVSWLPDLLAYAVDAFLLDWSIFYFYAVPPFALITRVLRKIITDKAEGILVVPWWPAQPWFPLFNRLISSQPIYF